MVVILSCHYSLPNRTVSWFYIYDMSLRIYGINEVSMQISTNNPGGWHKFIISSDSMSVGTSEENSILTTSYPCFFLVNAYEQLAQGCLLLVKSFGIHSNTDRAR